MVIVKLAEVASAGMVTVAGTERRVGRLEERLTVKSAIGVNGNVIVPVTGAEPSFTLAGTLTMIGATMNDIGSDALPFAETTNEYVPGVRPFGKTKSVLTTALPVITPVLLQLNV